MNGLNWSLKGIWPGLNYGKWIWHGILEIIKVFEEVDVQHFPRKAKSNIYYDETIKKITKRNKLWRVIKPLSD